MSKVYLSRKGLSFLPFRRRELFDISQLIPDCLRSQSSRSPVTNKQTNTAAECKCTWDRHRKSESWKTTDKMHEIAQDISHLPPPTTNHTPSATTITHQHTSVCSHGRERTRIRVEVAAHRMRALAIARGLCGVVVRRPC